MNRPQLLRTSLLITLLVTLAASNAAAQVRRPTTRPDDVRTLESKTQEAQTAYLTQLAELAKGYEASGDVEKAQDSLRQILRVSPDNQAVRDKLQELGDKVFDENQRGIEVDKDARVSLAFLRELLERKTAERAAR